jgi:enhancer of polycomb-like protein
VTLHDPYVTCLPHELSKFHCSFFGLFERSNEIRRLNLHQEHHLQAAIKSSQAVALGRKTAQAAIPTPHTEQSKIQYEKLYPPRFAQPATYIRFSSTVEDCSGCPYSMNGEDEAFRQTLPSKRIGKSPEPLSCSEDSFEVVMNFFEETAQTKQPFAAVDNPPVASFEEMEASYDEGFEEDARLFARDIYEHWKAQRLKKGNRTLLTLLKFETGQETDDADPYVCFRRREVRQVRKTRGRDAQSTEKLCNLRTQLEEGRQLIAMVKDRERNRRDVLAIDKQIFIERSKLRVTKRNLGNKEADEDLLINQKPKKRILEQPAQTVRMGQPRPASRIDGRSAEADLITLQETLADRDSEIQREIDLKIAQHNKWNLGFVDQTTAPLTPTPINPSSSSFRTAITRYLPTPPASVSSGASPPAEDPSAESTEEPRKRLTSTSLTYNATPSPSSNHPLSSQHRFRRRFGRGGRFFIDRRRGGEPASPTTTAELFNIDPLVADRFKYDYDSDSDDSSPAIYTMDTFAVQNMRYRASLLVNPREAQAHAHALAQVQAAQKRAILAQQAGATGDVAMTNGASTAGVSGGGSAAAGLPMSSSPPRPGSGG